MLSSPSERSSRDASTDQIFQTDSTEQLQDALAETQWALATQKQSNPIWPNYKVPSPRHLLRGKVSPVQSEIVPSTQLISPYFLSSNESA